MRRVRMLAFGLGIVGGVIFESPVAAGAWTAGTNLGVGVLSSSEPGGNNQVTVSWPIGASVVGPFQPGLRLGYVFDDDENELFVNTSLDFVGSNGQSLTITSNSLNFQHALRSGDVSPYFDAGAGLISEGGTGSTQYDWTFGAGTGLRRMVSSGHGALRAEVRADVLSTTLGQSALYNVGLQLGFDLWFK